MSSRIIKGTQLDFEQIKDIIPQRFPFLMLDRVVEVEPGVRVVGLKNLTGNEWFYQGHFPGRAITPGALIGEAIAQTGIVLFHVTKPKPDDVTFLLGSFKLRFLEIVIPGDQLRIEVGAIKITSRGGVLTARVTVGQKLVAKGEFTLAVKRNEEL